MTPIDLSTILAPVIGQVSKVIVNKLKESPWFNMLNKSDGKLRKHAMVFIVVSTLSLTVAYLNGSLNGDMLSDVILMMVNIFLGHGTAVTSHELTSE